MPEQLTRESLKKELDRLYVPFREHLIDYVINKCRDEIDRGARALVSDIMTKLGEKPTATEQPSQAGQSLFEVSPAKTGRAKFGSVQDKVAEILEIEGQTTTSKIISMAESQGSELRPQSVRMALVSLAKKGRAVQVNRNDWAFVPRRGNDDA